MLSALKSVSIIWTGMLLGAALSFLSQAILARILTLSEYGLFSAINNYFAVIAPIAGLGIGNYWLKKFGQNGWDGSLWVGPSLKLLAISIPVSLVFSTAIGHLIWNDALAQTLIILLSPTLIMQTFSNSACSVFQLEERFVALTIWRLTPILTRLLIILIVFQMGYKLLILGNYLFISSIIISILGYLYSYSLKSGGLLLIGHGSRKKFKSKSKRLKKTISTRNVLTEVTPFALGSFFGLIYMQSDIFIISLLAGNEQAGLYNAAFSIMTAIYMFPTAIFTQYLLPKYHRWSEKDLIKLLNVFRFGNAAMLLIGFIIMTAVIVLSPYIIPLIFGTKFTGTIDILIGLSLCIPLRFLSSSVGGCLVTQDNIKRKVTYQGIIAIINILLNLFLIPQYQAFGAVISTVTCEFFLLLTYLYGAKKYVFKVSVLKGWNLNWKSLRN